jgi:hypothetical protein
MNKLLTNLQAHPPANEIPWGMAGHGLRTQQRWPAARRRPRHPCVLADGDVLELELENGTRLLVAAEDAERYLGRAIGRDGADVAGAPGEIAVGPTLAPERAAPATRDQSRWLGCMGLDGVCACSAPAPPA